MLYTPEMEYLLEQFEELRGRDLVKRPDLIFCKNAQDVDGITGIAGLFGFRRGGCADADVEALFAPPADLAAWARGVLAAPAPKMTAALPEPELSISYPEARETAPPGTCAADAAGGDERGVRQAGVGQWSRGWRSRRARAARPARSSSSSSGSCSRLPLPVRRSCCSSRRLLRPRERFVARFELRDEISGAGVVFDRAFEVPAEATPEPVAAPAAPVVAAQDLGLAQPTRRDTLVLLPPVDDVVFGLWRADAIVAGDRIRKVVFYVDGKPQLPARRRPGAPKLRLPNIPKETVVRAEGLDAEGKVVASDEVLLNEPQGEARVKLLAPQRGAQGGRPDTGAGGGGGAGGQTGREGRVQAQRRHRRDPRAVRPGRRRPSAVGRCALLSHGHRHLLRRHHDVEDFRVLNAGDFSKKMQVDLVELYVTVTDRDGRLAEGLAAADFGVLDNGRPQKIAKFELVRDLPLTLGVVLDTSGSMRESIGEAKSAAQQFLARGDDADATAASRSASRTARRS